MAPAFPWRIVSADHDFPRRQAERPWPPCTAFQGSSRQIANFSAVASPPNAVSTQNTHGVRERTGLYFSPASVYDPRGSRRRSFSFGQFDPFRCMRKPT
jgi:hypothetical protein